MKLFRVYFDYDGEYVCKSTLAHNPDQARRNVKRDYPGAIIHKVKRERNDG